MLAPVREQLRATAPVAAADPSGEIISIYMREVGQYQMLTREEEIMLGRRVRRGDDLARERMILGNLRLVVKIAKDFSCSGVPLLDLIRSPAKKTWCGPISSAWPLRSPP